ncbi:MAG: tetratricopeptide repeat protein [Bacteroidales bacterium]|nr:tetratricopeptide repeat protein [Bacteroidales bacterium]
MIRFIFFILIPYILFAQKDVNEQLARQYYQQGEYEKAITFYEKIFTPTKVDLYDEYLTCLIKLEKWKDAEKLIGTMKKKNPYTVRYYADEIELYSLQNQSKILEKKLKESFDVLKNSETLLADYAQLLIDKKLLDAALFVLQEATKIFASSISLNILLAQVYRLKGNRENAVQILFNLYDKNQLFTENMLKEQLLSIMIEDDRQKHDDIHAQLLERVQKNPSNESYVSILIWFYEQNQEYYKALTQAKAIDRRTRNNGKFTFECAKTFYSLKLYDLALDALQFVLSQGEQGMFYYDAYDLMLEVQYDKLTTLPNPSLNELRELRDKIFQSYKQTYQTSSKFSLLQKLVYLDVFYLKQSQLSISLLREAIDSKIFTPLERGKLKLLLGDVLSIEGDPWEAVLLYAQVDKAFKNDTLGSYAKFCSARLYYFMNEIDYAQGLLEILRGATSKTIANDALELSLRIQMSIDYDSSYVPLQKLARAEWLMFGWKFDDAMLVLDTILKNFPDHPVQDYALLLMAKLYEKKKNYDKAIMFYQTLVDKGIYSHYADDALYGLAQLYDIVLQQPEMAKKYYEQLIFDFPSSYYSKQAIPRYREMRGVKATP